MKKFTTRILPFGLLLLFFFSFNSYAQQGPLTLVGDPVAVTGHLIRTTPKLADIDNTTMYGEPLKITRDMNGIIVDGSSEWAKNKRETKRILEEEMKARLDREYREATGMSKPEPKSEQLNSPGNNPNVPGTSLGVNFNGLTSAGLQPTDNNMAAGPNHLVQMVNNTSGSQYRIWTKGGAVLATGILASLTGRSGSGDPIVLYDQLADRWFMAEFGPSACCSELIIAVSNTPDPTGTWSVYSYIDATFFPDYPKFSVWHNAYYAYTRDFSPGGGSFLGSSVWAFDRAAMLAGAGTAQMVRQRITGANVSAIGSVGLEGMTPSSLGGHFIIPSSATTLNIFEVTQNFGASTINVGPFTPLTVNAWSASGSIAQQSGPNLGSLSPFLMFKLNYRNNGGTESIVLSQTIGNGPLGQVRWYELRRVAGNWTVFQQGNVPGADGNSRWMPGISMDGCGNIALMYNVAGTSSHPSIRYTGRNSFDPLNTMTLPEAVIFNAAAGSGGITRWGDYNTTVQDYTVAGNPNNGSFWSTAQHTNQLTRIANFTLTGGCAPAPNMTAGAATLTAEGCVANNGVIDPGETVTVSFCGLNVGTLNTTNLVGTMQVSGGVTPISGPQNYGVVVAGGAAVCRSFSFSNTSGTCGGTITVSIQWQDGATNLGTSTWTFTLGTTVVSSFQNFDAVVAPALPAGWVATNASGPAPLWVTRDNTSILTPVPSLPNSLFIDDPASISDKQIVTPSFIPGAGARVSFSGNYDLESGFDGGVLEISINGGAYQDILAAGGSFVAGGYTGVISNAFGNPLANRNSWTGTSGGFTTTTVNLPPASAGLPTQLKFRMGSDNSVSDIGWRVDNFSISAPACCGAVCTITCPANITVNTGPGATSCGTNVSFAATTSGLCGAITYSPASGSFFPKGTTTVTATTAAGPSCQFTVTVVDNTVPTIVCPANITVNNTPNLCSAPVTYALPTFNDNCPFGGGIPTTITQNSTNTIVAGSVSCNAGGLHTDNSYWRAFPLALSGPFTVNSVQFGIELANASGVGTTQPVTVRVHTSAGAFPAGVRTLVASQTFNIPDQTLSLYTATFTTPPQVASNAILVLEIFTPSGQAAGHSFFIGSNAAAETATSYLSAAACGITTPTPVGAIGFPNMHIVLNAIGTVPNPAGALAQIAGLPSGSVFPVGVTTNTFRVTDAVGLTADCSFTVTVVDNQAPVVTCPANIVTNTDPGVCIATVATPNPTTSDNCGVTSVSWVLTGATTGASPLTGINYVGTRAFNLNGTTGFGITTVTYTVKDAAGNTSTCSYTVRVNDASIPVISGQPTNQFVCVGSNGAFSVTATAGAGNPLTYQWQRWDGSAWVNIAGATAATLPLNAVTFSMNTNSYRVILTGRCSEVISGFATLYVNRLPTVVLAASRIPILLPTESVNLVVTVDPTGGTYQWYLNGSATPIPGVTGATYAGLTVDNIGTYTVKYTDLNGCVSTTNAITVSGAPSGNLYVYPNPNFGQFSVRFFNQAGESATITVYDAKGARVFQRQMVTTTAYTKLDVELGPTTNSGVYLVEVLNSTGKVIGSKRVIVRHP